MKTTFLILAFIVSAFSFLKQTNQDRLSKMNSNHEKNGNFPTPKCDENNHQMFYNNIQEKPVITLEAYNSVGGSKIKMNFDQVHVNAKGKGQASSPRVQFNINYDAVKGSIFVNEKNNGVAIVEIQGDHKITRAWYEIDQDNVYTFNSEANSKKILEIVNIPKPTILFNKRADFRVTQKGASTIVGNIALTFFVEFE